MASQLVELNHFYMQCDTTSDGELADIKGFWWVTADPMNSVLSWPFKNNTPYNLAFEDQNQIKSTNSNEICDSVTPEQLNDGTPSLMAYLSCAKWNGLMI